MTGEGSTDRFVYDEVPYPTSITPALTPDRIRGAAIVQGYRPAVGAGASFLEIGCGEGHNLLGIAAAEPGVRCVGFDLSSEAIGRGRALVESVGMDNVDLHAGDIMTYPRDGERFDYIACHGVYTWIPLHVRPALLELIAARLAPGGIAYVSMDCLPGAAAKVQINRFLRDLTRHIPDTGGKIAEAARLVGLLASNQREDSRLKAQLDQLVHELPHYDPYYFFHDFLADHYAPVLTADFAAAAGAYGLKTIGNVDLTDGFTLNFSDVAKEYLAKVEGDYVAHVHLLDFLRGSQMFRRVLMVREDAPPPRVEPGSLDGLLFELQGEREVGGDESGKWVKFSRGSESFILARSDSDIGVMDALIDVTPGELSFDQIAERTGLPRADIAETLRKVMSIGVVLPRTPPQPFVIVPGERPVVSPLVRAMMKTGNWSITLRHARFVTEVEPTRHFITLCDGTRTRDDLAAAMSEKFAQPIGVAQIEAGIADLGPRRIFVA